MADHHPGAIANEFVELNGGPLPQMKLHKLAYIAHGWNLAVNKEPLISEAPEAWDNGPVFRSIWDSIRDNGMKIDGRVIDDRGRPYDAELTKSEKRIISHTWSKYHRFSQFDLSDMTHRPGTPWTETYFSNGRNAQIPDKLILKHYVKLALAGRAGK